MAMDLSVFFVIKYWVTAQLIISLLANISGICAYNIAVFLFMLWSSYKYEEFLEPLFTSLVLLLFTVILDFTWLGIYAGDIIKQDSGYKYADTAKFCLAMTMLNLFIKPITLFIAGRAFHRQNGGFMLRQGVPYSPVQSQATAESVPPVAGGGYQSNEPAYPAPPPTYHQGPGQPGYPPTAAPF